MPSSGTALRVRRLRATAPYCRRIPADVREQTAGDPPSSVPSHSSATQPHSPCLCPPLPSLPNAPPIPPVKPHTNTASSSSLGPQGMARMPPASRGPRCRMVAAASAARRTKLALPHDPAQPVPPPAPDSTPRAARMLSPPACKQSALAPPPPGRPRTGSTHPSLPGAWLPLLSPPPSPPLPPPPAAAPPCLAMAPKPHLPGPSSRPPCPSAPPPCAPSRAVPGCSGAARHRSPLLWPRPADACGHVHVHADVRACVCAVWTVRHAPSMCRAGTCMGRGRQGCSGHALAKQGMQ